MIGAHLLTVIHELEKEGTLKSECAGAGNPPTPAPLFASNKLELADQ